MDVVSAYKEGDKSGVVMSGSVPFSLKPSPASRPGTSISGLELLVFTLFP